MPTTEVGALGNVDICFSH